MIKQAKNYYFQSIFEIKGYKTIHCAIILRSDSHTQTLPPNVNRGRTLNQNPAKNHPNQSTISKSQSQIRQRSVSENRNGSSVEEDIVIYRLPGEKLGLGLRFGFLQLQSFQEKKQNGLNFILDILIFIYKKLRQLRS